MNRGQLLQHVRDLVEDYDGTGQIAAAKINRALNRVAENVHLKIDKSSHNTYTLGEYQFAMDGGLVYPLLGVYDFMRARANYPDTPVISGTLVNRMSFEGPRRDDAVLIPRQGQHREQYASNYCGVQTDRAGRSLYYIEYNPARCNAVQTITLTSVPDTVASGNWTITINGETATVAHNVTAADLHIALEALSTVGLGQIVRVTELATPKRFVIEFGGSMGFQDVETVTVGNGTMVGFTTSAIATKIGQPIASIVFVSTPQNTRRRFLYSRKCRQINPDATRYDELTYETIPEEWHNLLAYGAAVELMGKRLEPASPLMAWWADQLQMLERHLNSQRTSVVAQLGG